MDSVTPLLLIVLTAAALIWFSAVRARETAVNACRLACGQCNVQFLDQTVRLTGLNLTRSDSGSLGLRRHFRFEFSEAGADRHPGSVMVFDGRAREVILDGSHTGRLVIPLGGGPT